MERSPTDELGSFATFACGFDIFFALRFLPGYVSVLYLYPAHDALVGRVERCIGANVEKGPYVLLIWICRISLQHSGRLLRSQLGRQPVGMLFLQSYLP